MSIKDSQGHKSHDLQGKPEGVVLCLAKEGLKGNCVADYNYRNT